MTHSPDLIAPAGRLKPGTDPLQESLRAPMAAQGLGDAKARAEARIAILENAAGKAQKKTHASGDRAA